MTYDVPSNTNIPDFIKAKGVLGGDIFKLQPNGQYFFNSSDGKLRFDFDVTIEGYLIQPSVITARPTAYVSGIKRIKFKNLVIEGRINIDDEVNTSEDVKFENVLFKSSAGTSGTEIVKLTRNSGVIFRGCGFIRTKDINGNFVGAPDRLLDIVGGKAIVVQYCNFVDGNNGAIQAKGGVDGLVFHDNFVNYCGQRAIQIGGSTCWHPQNDPPIGCWGKRNGVYINPSEFGWEAKNCQVHDNIVVSNGSCISVSTASVVQVFDNNFYIPRDTGGIFLMRFLQEVEEDTVGLINPSARVSVFNNAFFYPTTRDDGRAGINGAVINWNDGQNFNSFEFHNNAVYATSPITSPGFGVRGIYQHRHMVTDGPSKYMPFNWKTDLLDQVYPDVIDWGLPTMVAHGYRDKHIGCSSDKVGASHMPYGRIAPSPISLRGYSAAQNLYGWEGCGSYRYPDKLSKVSEALNNVKW